MGLFVGLRYGRLGLLLGLAFFVLVLVGNVASARAERFQVVFDRGLVDFGGSAGVEVGGPVGFDGDFDSGSGVVLFPADGVELPSRDFSVAGLSGRVSFGVAGARLSGSWNPSNGRLSVQGQVRVSVALDSGVSCQFSVGLILNTDVTVPYRARRFVSGADGSGAIATGWDDLPAFSGGPGCDLLSDVVDGPGGIWLARGDVLPRGTRHEHYRKKLPVVHIDTEGRAPVVEKETWIRGSMRVDPNGSGVESFEGGLDIRGRGNSTWGKPKNPYKLRLNEKAALFGMPTDRRWELLAHYFDRSWMRNSIAFYLGWQTGLDWTPHDRSVEVVLNGEYLGIYSMTENKSLGKDRINVEAAGPGDNAGQALTGGYVMELDKRMEEFGLTGFRTENDVPLIFEEPEEPTQAQFSYMQSYVQDFEDALFADDFAQTREYTNYIDVDSFVDAYLVNEVTKNYDAHQASLLFVKPRGKKLRMGPLWDYDQSMGSQGLGSREHPGTHTGWRVRTLTTWINRLWKDPAFVQRVAVRWAELKPSFLAVGEFIDFKAQELSGAAENDQTRWAMAPALVEDPEFLKGWLASRVAWLSPGIPNVVLPNNQVVLNEVNCTGADWIELYNPTGSDVQVGGWLLTDDPLDRVPLRDSHRHLLPGEAVVPAGGYLKVNEGPGGFPFGISCDDKIILANHDNAPIDQIELDGLDTGSTAFARTPDGGSVWAWRKPTPGTGLGMRIHAKNDHFANATRINGQFASFAGHNFQATRENAEPLPDTGSGESSVWYRWTAPRAGTITVDTCGTRNHDTTLTIYTGENPDVLNHVAGTITNCDSHGTSTLFQAAAGLTYHFQIASTQPSTQGAFQINLNRSPGQAPIIITAPPGTTTNTTATFEFEPGPDDATVVTGFECALDNQPYVACGSPRTYTNLALGEHTFNVRAINNAGPGPHATHTWKVEEKKVVEPPDDEVVNPPDDEVKTPKPHKARLGELKVAPMRKVVRRGRSYTVGVRVRNVGEATATRVRVCVKAPKRVVKVKGCLKVARILAGRSGVLRFKVKVRSRASRGQKIVLRFEATARGVGGKQGRAVVRVR